MGFLDVVLADRIHLEAAVLEFQFEIRCTEGETGDLTLGVEQ
jgi:hypothetical protein